MCPDGVIAIKDDFVSNVVLSQMYNLKLTSLQKKNAISTPGRIKYPFPQSDIFDSITGEFAFREVKLQFNWVSKYESTMAWRHKSRPACHLRLYFSISKWMPSNLHRFWVGHLTPPRFIADRRTTRLSEFLVMFDSFAKGQLNQSPPS